MDISSISQSLPLNGVKVEQKTHEQIIISFKFFILEMFTLIKSPIFLFLTFLGNSIIGIFSFIFYQVESGANTKVITFVDALWWGFATATTTGYGDITPATTFGKFLGMLLMLTGMAFFAMFTALFAETFLASSGIKKK